MKCDLFTPHKLLLFAVPHFRKKLQFKSDFLKISLDEKLSW